MSYYAGSRFSNQMKILAINDGIGSSLGVFEDGQPLFCIQEERFTRVKNDMGFPEQALQYVLNSGMVSPDDVDQVALCNDNYTARSKESFYARYDENFKKATSKNPITAPVNTAKSAARRTLEKNKKLHQAYTRMKSKMRDEDRLKELGFDESKFTRVTHHLCHAAAAYYGLARDLDEEYLVFTLDGGGDGATSTIYRAKGGKMEKLVESQCFSIGNIYSDITYCQGFTPHEHEYKLMGLAPYVNPQYIGPYKEYFSKFLELTKDDTEFCNPSPMDHALCFSKLTADFKKDRFDNICAGLQAFTEEICTRWVRGAIKKYKISNVLCSGGVFMNVKLNKLISSMPEVSYIDVFPSCGDESNIFGAAFHVHNEQKEPAVALLSRYTLGTSPNGDLQKALEKYTGQVTVEEVDDPNEFIAEQLEHNRIVARCSGDMEFGARALGNRSILANPKDLITVNKINRAIKKRDFWMPFAPAVLEDRLDEILHVPESLKQQASPYMMFAFDTVDDKRDQLACGIHQADFTARAETVNPERYPDFYAIINAFYKRTGIPSVLNTSFNLHGFPIVENSDQAIHVLLNSELDMLVIGNYVIRRTADTGNQG